MSNHLMQRLSIAREDPAIRQALPPGSFRSSQQAAAESRMMRAAAFGKIMAGKQQEPQMGAPQVPPAPAPAPASNSISMFMQPGGGGGGATSAARPSAWPAHPHHPHPHQAPAQVAPSQVAPQPTLRPSAPSGPYVFRRASRTVQITDPASGDLLQLDAGTWVLTDAAPTSASRGAAPLLRIYTTDAESGAVMAYDIPLADEAGRPATLSSFFDLHTLNPLETAAAAGDVA